MCLNQYKRRLFKLDSEKDYQKQYLGLELQYAEGKGRHETARRNLQKKPSLQNAVLSKKRQKGEGVKKGSKANSRKEGRPASLTTAQIRKATFIPVTLLLTTTSVILRRNLKCVPVVTKLTSIRLGTQWRFMCANRAPLCHLYYFVYFSVIQLVIISLLVI